MNAMQAAREPVEHLVLIPHSLLVSFLAADWVVLVAALAFCIRYTMLCKWWKVASGQTIVALDFCLILVFGQGLFKHYIWHDEPAGFFAWFDLGVILLIATIVIYRLCCLEYQRRSSRRKI